MPSPRSLLLACAATFALSATTLIATPLAAKPSVEVAFVLDTTGSMGGLIEGAKRKIWSIATTIADSNPDADIRMALIAYRDIGDEYVVKTFDLTTDIQDLYAHLLELKARGGGDWPESVNEALDASITKLNWSKNEDASRIVFLVGDAPPHMDYAQDTKYPETLKAARQKDILVNAVQAGGARDTERVWRDIAQLGGGKYMAIPQDGGEVVVIETPYDDEIIILQKKINGTVVPYGSRAEQKRVEDKTAQVAAAPAASASDMAGYLNRRAKTSAEAITGGGDLVADVAAGRAQIDKVKEDELPKPMREMSAAQRTDYLNRQLAERKELNEKLATIVAQRDRHIAQVRAKEEASRPGKGKGDSFDRVVAETLKAQMRR